MTESTIRAVIDAEISHIKRRETHDAVVINLFLDGKRILVLKGLFDGTIPSESTARLVEALMKTGAQVKIVEIEAGHELTARDLEAASTWLSGIVSPGRVELVN